MVARGFVLRYGAAVVWSSVAFLLTEALPDRIEPHVSSLFFGAVMLSGWSGGFGPGVLATALCALGRVYLLEPPLTSLTLAVDDAIPLILFAVVAVFISYLNEARLRAEARHVDLLIREKVARVKAEATESRYAALSEAAKILTSALDPEKTVARVADLAVPFFADSCVVDLLRKDGSLRRIAKVQRDGETAASTSDPRPRDAQAEELVARVVRTRRPEVTPTSVIVPLVARGETLGVMSFWLSGSDRSYGSEDAALAQDLSRYAALALDPGRSAA